MTRFQKMRAWKDDDRVYFSYNQIHKILYSMKDKISKEFKPDVILAIGGGGYLPARVLRTFLKVTSHNFWIFDFCTLGTMPQTVSKNVSGSNRCSDIEIIFRWFREKI